MQGNSTRRAFSLSEMVVAIGVLGLIAVVFALLSSKSQQLNRREIDLSAAFTYCESEMERLALLASATTTFDQVVSTGYVHPQTSILGQVPHDDRRFVRRVDVVDLASDLKKVTVTIWEAQPGTTQPDASRPRGGEVLRMTNIYSR